MPQTWGEHDVKKAAMLGRKFSRGVSAKTIKQQYGSNSYNCELTSLIKTSVLKASGAQSNNGSYSTEKAFTVVT